MGFDRELELLLRARYPLIYVPTLEEERLEATIAATARAVGQRAVYIWDFVDGYQGNPNVAGVGRRNPLEALEYLEKLPGNVAAIAIFRDLHRFLEDISIARKLRNLARIFKSRSVNIIALAPEVRIPSDLTEAFTIVDFPLPTADEIRSEMQRLLGPLSPAPEVLEEFIAAARGLSLERIRRVLTRIVAARIGGSALQTDDAEPILAEKRQSIRQTQILEFYPAVETMADIGGLDNLKDWLLRRGGAFSERARAYGLPQPRGLLLVGIQGTGKSLTAKAIAHRWQLPLLRLDVGRLFAGLVGESEARTRQAIALAEALAPCVLWIDEIDKAFAAAGDRGDGGTSRRVFGTFLTWLAEKRSPVFVVATANNLQMLPPELLRKGRFDEVFFVGLPARQERREIFAVHLQRFRPHNLASFDLDRLAYETPDFSGAEIEQAIVEAMHIGFSQDRDFTTEDILSAVSQIVPLARTAQEEIQALQAWVADGKARLASRDRRALADRN